MLFTESQLNVFNPFDILDNAVYLTEEESMTAIQTVPVVQNGYYNVNMIDFKDIERISEEYDCDMIDAMSAIIESENLNPEMTTIVVDEADFILNADILGEDVIIRPISEYEFESIFVNECVNAWLESGDEDYLLCITEAAPRINKDGSVDISNSSDEEVESFLQSKARKLTSIPSKFTGAPQNAEEASKRGQQIKLRDKLTQIMNNTVKAHSAYQAQRDKNEANSWRASSDMGLDANPTDWTQQAAPSSKVSLVRPGSKKKGKPLSMFQRGKHAVTGAPGKFAGTMKGYGNILSGKTQIEDEHGNKLSKFQMLKQHAAANKGSTAAAAVGAAAVIGGGIYAYKQYKNKPKSVIAKRIAALRSIYSKFMRQVQSNPQKANMLKRAAAKILSVIDKLMGYLQNKADGR